MRAHLLKSWPKFFDLVRRGMKPFELRNAVDRDFRLDDFVVLAEWNPETKAMTGNYECRRITSIHAPNDTPLGLYAGFLILGLAMPALEEISALTASPNSPASRAVEWIDPL